MTGTFGTFLYYLNTALWILGWALVAVAAGVGVARSGRRILIAEIVLASIMVLVRIVHLILTDPNFGLLHPRGGFASASFSNYQTWTTANGIISAGLFTAFCICLAIDRFTLPRPQQAAFLPEYRQQQY